VAGVRRARIAACGSPIGDVIDSSVDPRRRRADPQRRTTRRMATERLMYTLFDWHSKRGPPLFISFPGGRPMNCMATARRHLAEGTALISLSGLLVMGAPLPVGAAACFADETRLPQASSSADPPQVFMRPSAGACEPGWLPTFGGAPGVDGAVNALAPFDDGSGSGPELHVAGFFQVAGGVAVNSIAKWDGSTWSPLGSGTTGGIWALAVFDDGSGAGPALFAGGQFGTIGGVTANSIAKWDGLSWSPVGTGLDGSVRALVVHDDGRGGGPALHAAGNFQFAGDQAVNGIAKWNGSTWAPLGSGVIGDISALATFDDGSGSGPALYAGGVFSTIGGVSANSIAKWDGASWSPLEEGVEGGISGVTELVVFDDGKGRGPALYVGGAFWLAGGEVVAGFAKWTGTSWSEVDGIFINGDFGALGAFDDGLGGGPALYVGATYTLDGELSAASGIARWDGSEWSKVVAGQYVGQAAVKCFAVFDDGAGDDLYAGGLLPVAGVGSINGVAGWDGSTWSWFGFGLNGWVNELLVHDARAGDGDRLYASGQFSAAGGAVVNGIASWDGESWSPLGEGLGGGAGPMLVFDDGTGGGPMLHVGGGFSQSIGEVQLNGIAKWDGSAWLPLGQGTNGTVAALAEFDSGAGNGPELYAAGGFGLAGGGLASHIAKWDGASWSPLGLGVDGWVSSLAVFDDGMGGGPALYVGGSFNMAGGQPASRIAKWDGRGWSGVGGGMNSDVGVLAVLDEGSGRGPALYAGGSFTLAGGVPASRIARWDGTSWSPVGSGFGNSSVAALAIFDDGSGSGPALFAGGGFSSAGGAPAQRVAKWDGSTWSPLGIGLTVGSSPYVHALAVFDDGSDIGPALIVGGSFLSSPALDSNLARWGGCPGQRQVFGDLSGDGSVDGADLGLMLGAWGACQGCPADLDGSGVVDGGDLGLLLGAWGS